MNFPHKTTIVRICPPCWRTKSGKCNYPKTNNIPWKWNFVMRDGEVFFYAMGNGLKHFIPILYAKIPSKSLSQGKNILSKS